MAPVNQARLEVAKAQDEVARRDLALKSAEQEAEVAKQEVNIAKLQIDQNKAILNKANFDRNSQIGLQAQKDLTMYQAQLDAAQAHQSAAKAAADLAAAQKKQAEAERELAQAAYRRSMMLGPTSWQTWFLIGRDHRRLGHAEVARLAYRRALDASPEEPELLFELGTLLCEMELREDGVDREPDADEAGLRVDLGVDLPAAAAERHRAQGHIRRRDVKGMTASGRRQHAARRPSSGFPWIQRHRNAARQRHVAFAVVQAATCHMHSDQARRAGGIHRYHRTV